MKHGTPEGGAAVFIVALCDAIRTKDVAFVRTGIAFPFEMQRGGTKTTLRSAEEVMGSDLCAEVIGLDRTMESACPAALRVSATNDALIVSTERVNGEPNETISVEITMTQREGGFLVRNYSERTYTE